MRRRYGILSGASILLPAAASAVVLNTVETFNGGLVGFGGPVNYSILTGGVDGPSDGFLAITSASPNIFATRVIQPGPFTGNYRAIGANAVQFSLLDLDSEDSVVVRVGFGIRNVNFWVSNLSFDPVFGAPWQEVTVSFDDASGWTQVIGAGGATDFELALENAETFQIRADAVADGKEPDTIAGSIGIDNVSFLAIPEPGIGLLLALLPGCFLRRSRAV